MSFCMYHSEFSELFEYPQDVMIKLKEKIEIELDKIEIPENLKKETVLGVEYAPSPKYGTRYVTEEDEHTIIDSKTNYTVADDKQRYPSIFEKEFMVGIKTNVRKLYFPVYGKFRWNNADIIGPIQIIALCGKDDRRVILGSGIHDYLLEYKQYIYKMFLQQDETLTIDEFRWITSDTFRFIIESQGMGHKHAVIMANAVDYFQKHFQKKKWNILKEI